MDRRPPTCPVGFHHRFWSSPPVTNPGFICIYILYFILCYYLCSLLASRFLSFWEWFPAISQSQFSIQDASLKKLRTYSAIPYSLSMTTTCWCITHSLSPGRNPSQQRICGSLAPTEATYLIFDDFCMCYILFCTWGRRSWSAEPEIREVQRRQLEPHHIPCLLIDLMPMPHEHTRRSPFNRVRCSTKWRHTRSVSTMGIAAEYKG